MYGTFERKDASKLSERSWLDHIDDFVFLMGSLGCPFYPKLSFWIDYSNINHKILDKSSVRKNTTSQHRAEHRSKNFFRSIIAAV